MPRIVTDRSGALVTVGYLVLVAVRHVRRGGCGQAGGVVVPPGAGLMAPAPAGPPRAEGEAGVADEAGGVLPGQDGEGAVAADRPQAVGLALVPSADVLAGLERFLTVKRCNCSPWWLPAATRRLAP